MFWLARDATSSLSLAVFVSFYNIDIMGSQEESIRLIQLYSTYKALWDPKDPKYLNKNQREDSWRQISAQMNTRMSVKEVKKKMDSLCGSYRREKSREKKSRISGSGAADVYNSKWFGYPYFDFLKDKNETGDTQETIPNEVIPESSQTSDGERHTETENAPTQSQLRNLAHDDDAVLAAINDSDFGEDSDEDENWVPPGEEPDSPSDEDQEDDVRAPVVAAPATTNTWTKRSFRGKPMPSVAS
ncbi:uncharacterized protein LOC106141475 [Amyelois transitella]|uniref:uncharacterized protein LOC106141475 n=1 Tax=Amyelois transitella TaxID=680683 RepID=UPI00298FFFCF|nr:uncharacterized protein LOC106141475 [Amyelois transitella]